MADIVIMPKLGFEMAEGTLVRWVVQEGEPVSKGAVLAEIETFHRSVIRIAKFDIPWADRGSNNSCSAKVLCLLTEQFSASPTSAASSVALLLTTGIAPGRSVHVGQMLVFGSGAEP